jgi:hypothetical protein
MPKQITVVLLDSDSSSTPHYLELVREELIKRLKPTRLWVASVEVASVQETAPIPLEGSIVKI